MSLQFVENKSGETPLAKIVAKFATDMFDSPNDGLSDNLTLETIRMFDKPEMFDSSLVRMIESKSFLNAGTSAILMTSVRQSIFLKNTRLGKAF